MPNSPIGYKINDFQYMSIRRLCPERFGPKTYISQT